MERTDVDYAMEPTTRSADGPKPVAPKLIAVKHAAPKRRGFSGAFFGSPRFFRSVMNVWPPYWGTGISVAEVAPDFRSMRVRMARRFYNGNALGTHFGGSLYAMCDPHYVLLLIAILGDEYVVWDRAARIEFLRPGRTDVTAVFAWSEEELAEIRARTEGGAKVEPEKTVEVVDAHGEVVARVHKTLYVRRAKR